MAAKRPAIPAHIKRAAWAKNKGFCTAPDCKAKGVILEHIETWFVVQEHTLENLEPRCADHALAKTKDDMKVIAKIRRLQGHTGQWARRQRKGPQMKSRGFSKTLRKKMDGTITMREGR
jgi:hypothetical protein